MGVTINADGSFRVISKQARCEGLLHDSSSKFVRGFVLYLGICFIMVVRL